MKLPVALPRSTLAVPALALPAIALIGAFAAPRAPAEEITFRRTPGQRLAFVFASEAELDLTDMSMSRDDEEWEGDMPEWTISHEEKIAFTDEVLEAEDGRILKLRRTFDEISETRKNEISAAEGSHSDEGEGASELEDATVVFTWDADLEEYEAAFEDGEGDLDLLEELECRVDFAEFLPQDSVAKGDTWTVEAKAFNGIVAPGGDLHVLFEDEEPEEEGGMSDQLADNVEGEISCKLVDLREEDGVRIAVIALQAKLRTHGVEEGEIEAEVGTVSTTQEVRIEYALDGEFLWNLSAGHVAGIELAGSLDYEMDGVQELSGVTYSRKQTFEGTVAHHVSAQ